jgi:hypothetical protein
MSTRLLGTTPFRFLLYRYPHGCPYSGTWCECAPPNALVCREMRGGVDVGTSAHLSYAGVIDVADVRADCLYNLSPAPDTMTVMPVTNDLRAQIAH